jgi:hypothetical protein
MQLQSIEVAPSNQAGVAKDGGVRILLSITGLPANTLIQSFYGWYPYSPPPVHGSPVCTVPPCNGVQPNPSRALLTLPGFVVRAGNNGVSFPLTSNSMQTVGDEGTVQVELLYPGQGTPDGTTGTLVISNLQFLVATGGQSRVKETLPGTWTLEIPLQS